MLRHRVMIGRVWRTVLLGALLAAPELASCAEWQGALGVAVQRFENTEFDKAGTILVRESGWLPGLAARGNWQATRFGVFAGGEVSQHGIAYHGQTQGGTPAESTSATRLIQLRAGASYAVNERFAGFVAGEWDDWRRNIDSTASATGLQERSASARLVLGGRAQWARSTASVFGIDGALVLARPERLDVGFSGLLDATTLTTRRARGWRAGVSARPTAVPRLELRAGFDTITVARSGDVPIMRSGRFVGTIAQPEHARRSISLTLSQLF